ncbi:MAG TPA: hypothetical protein DCZ30_03755 [Clostridiales bacterium]|nr:hypothetical protein [Clostridiales bacterium]
MDLHGHFHGYRTISSPFGRRSSPTKGASSYHSGIDIPAPPGTNIFSAESGTVILAKFNGSGGCTIIISSASYQFIYCHVSPNFLVYQNQFIKKGELIAQVGPKNVYGFSNNPYKDSNGNPTNGATTGPHLHFTIKKRRHSRQSIKLFLSFTYLHHRHLYLIQNLLLLNLLPNHHLLQFLSNLNKKSSYLYNILLRSNLTLLYCDTLDIQSLDLHLFQHLM